MEKIKSKEAINDILRYDTKLKEIANQQLYYENYQNKAIDLGVKIFDINKLLSLIRQPDIDFRETQFELLNEDAYLMKNLGNLLHLNYCKKNLTRNLHPKNFI